jgi:hypothetical protein
VVAIYDAQNASEFVTATDFEQFGNVHAYGVLTGCGVTESASNMNITVAAGAVVYQGGPVTVAGDTVALVADSSNLRWCYIYIDDAGDVQVALGDPAPNAQTEPSKPAVTGVILKAYKVQPGQTIADNVAIQIDKAIQAHPLTYVARTTSNFTKNTNTTLGDVTGLAFPIGASEVWAVEVEMQTTSNVSGGMKFAFTVPAAGAVTGNVVFGAAAAIVNVRSADLTAASGSTTAIVTARITAMVVNSTTAGTVQLQAAQNASHASDSIVYAQSFLKAWRVA